MKLFIKISKIALMVSINLLSLLSFGQTNTIKVVTDLGTHYDYAHSIAIQSNGKIFVAGDAYGNPCMICFDTTGVLDPTFGSDGKVFASWDCGSNPADSDIKIQPDGKIVLGTRYYNGANDDFVVARYNTDGIPDISFGNNGHVITRIGYHNDWCNSISIQSNGKILAGGGANVNATDEFSYDFALIRYNSDGTIDSAFGNNGKVTTHIGLWYNIAYSIAIQPNGKIIMVGEARDSLYSYSSDFAIVRYNSDGSLDHSFGNAGILRTSLSESYDVAKSVILQSDDKILVAGKAGDSSILVRYKNDGSLDSAFGTNGTVVAGESIENMAIQSDYKIILVGSSGDFATMRYNINGIIDSSFGTNGLITTSFGNGCCGYSWGEAVAIGNDGEILIAGSFNHGPPEYFDFALVRLFSKLHVILSPPTLLSPPDGAIGQSTDPTMTWDIVTGAISYNIQMSTSSKFDSNVIYCTGLPSNIFSVSGLSNETTYYWKVSSNNDIDTSAWSEIWNFSTAAYSVINDKNTKQLKLYPIPITDVLLIDGIEDEIVTFSILSMEGKLIKQLHGFGIREIDFCNIQQGIFLLKIINTNINYTKRIMKL
jgi:uncharacterized delta-60 repeat protein